MNAEIAAAPISGDVFYSYKEIVSRNRKCGVLREIDITNDTNFIYRRRKLGNYCAGGKQS
jgi:hypothetical protein